ncbi:MAG: hypothetical protein HY290_27070 [Planctomycetia bacterium]|nr:hypothetical protein [Planctomycetia bacterium]
MTPDEPPLMQRYETRRDEGRVDSARSGGRFARIVRGVQVRLRFVIVLAAAFLIVGMWGNLRNVWDTCRHRLFGASAGQQSVSIDTEYFCPMCPGVISDWPAVCPVCSMDLVRRKKGEAILLPEGVVARMQLSPYRVQLAGIATSVIENRPLAREFTVAGRLVEISAPESTPAGAENGRGGSAAASNLSLECDVPIGDLALLTPLTPGRSAQIIFDEALGGAALSGRIEAPDSPVGAAPGRRMAIVRIRLLEAPPWARPGMYGQARVALPLAELEPFASLHKASWPDSAPGFAAVPESAVVDTGRRRVVFVETMPGMFDGIEVTLGPRCGDYFPVLKGIESGQKVATVGAFLIDAEARRSPNLAAAYFGAARTSDTQASGAAAAPKPASKRAKKQAAIKLSAADLQLVKRQKICPVTEADLDSMGGPVPVDVAGQRVFICCKACEKPLKADPQKYLAKLKKN